MKQKELLKAIQQETGLDAATVSDMTVKMTGAIRGFLSEGDFLSIQGFGSFEVRKKEERVSVHPASGKRFIVPPKLVPVFRPGVTMKDKIKSLESHE